MKTSRIKTALLGSGAALALLATTVPASADQIGDLRTQIEAMQARIAKMEADRTQKRSVSAAAAVEAGDKPKSWKLPGTNTSMNIGGYTKFDILWDLGPAGGLAFGGAPAAEFTTLRGATNGGNILFSARQSRVWFKTWTPTDWGELATHIEVDFFGAGHPAGSFRMRHAYGRLGPVLAGQTWSTWMPVWAGPEVIDFGGPIGAIFVRQPMLRYTHNFGGGTFFQFAFEAPAGDAITAAVPTVGGTLVPTTTGGAQSVPDIVITLFHNFKMGRIWVGGIFRQIEMDTGGLAGTFASDDAVFGWGVSVAGAFKFTKKIRAGFQVYYGAGIGKYVPGIAAFSHPVASGLVAGDGSLTAVATFGGYIWGQYRWTDTIRSTVAWSYLDVYTDNAVPRAQIPLGTLQNASSLHVNLIWSPVPQVNIGIEYIHGFFGLTHSTNSNQSRIQIGFQYKF